MLGVILKILGKNERFFFIFEKISFPMASQKCVVIFLLLGESFKGFLKKMSSINAKSTYLK
jgi:hypothetical protein